MTIEESIVWSITQLKKATETAPLPDRDHGGCFVAACLKGLLMRSRFSKRQLLVMIQPPALE